MQHLGGEHIRGTTSNSNGGNGNGRQQRSQTHSGTFYSTGIPNPNPQYYGSGSSGNGAATHPYQQQQSFQYASQEHQGYIDQKFSSTSIPSILPAPPLSSSASSSTRGSLAPINIPPSNPDFYVSLSGVSPITPSTSGSSSQGSSSTSTPPLTTGLNIPFSVQQSRPLTQPPSLSLSPANSYPRLLSNPDIPRINTPSGTRIGSLKVSRPYSANPIAIGAGGIVADPSEEVKEALVKEEKRRRNKESSQKHRDRTRERAVQQVARMEFLENRVKELETLNTQEHETVERLEERVGRLEEENEELKREVERVRGEILRLQQFVDPGVAEQLILQEHLMQQQQIQFQQQQYQQQQGYQDYPPHQ